MRFPSLLDTFFLLGTTAGLSSVLYYALPEGTAKFFGATEVSTVTKSWVRIVSAGDALYAYLYIVGLYSPASVKKMIVRGLGLFGILHFSAFYLAHRDGPPHPKGYPEGYLMSCALAAAGGLWFGFIRPPTDENNKKTN